jgi:hypothetical protein
MDTEDFPHVLIVGMCGAAGHGKTTGSDMIKEMFNTEPPYAMAGPLKKSAAACFTLLPEQIYGTQEEKETIDPRWGTSARVILQKMGVLLRERPDLFGVTVPDGLTLWVYHFKAYLDGINKDGAVVVVSDVRFPDEVDILASKHPGRTSVLLHIYSEERARKRRKLDEETSSSQTSSRAIVKNHASEDTQSVLDASDKHPGLLREVSNDGSLEDLRQKIRSILLPLMKPATATSSTTMSRKRKRRRTQQELLVESKGEINW